ncbi:hypothetical protein NUW58_g1255 [Xylaria curta]|uniref:Uncharacterized protein n=1 Tax=Xylaria curta TaxID=42375 RepID=A0ACC1PMF5_9PEZI|nr:hypothetical protein NUW58_g1255 [Xylaria curta]
MAFNQPQPDFNAISAVFTGLGQQFGRYGNVAAATQSTAILEAVNRIQETLITFQRDTNTFQRDTNTFQQDTNRRLDHIEGRFDKLESRFDDLDGRFDDLDSRFDKLDGRFDKLEQNVSAKLGNQLVVEPDSAIEPLISVLSGEELPDFPKTNADIDKLNARDLTYLLEQLGQQSRGWTPEEKRKRFRYACVPAVTRVYDEIDKTFRQVPEVAGSFFLLKGYSTQAVQALVTSYITYAPNPSINPLAQEFSKYESVELGPAGCI